MNGPLRGAWPFLSLREARASLSLRGAQRRSNLLPARNDSIELYAVTFPNIHARYWTRRHGQTVLRLHPHQQSPDRPVHGNYKRPGETGVGAYERPGIKIRRPVWRIEVSVL